MELQLPSAVDSEQAILGAAMMNQQALLTLMDKIPDANTFYSPKHRIIYEAMLSLASNADPVDIVTVSRKLDDTGKMDKVTRTYVASLAEIATTTTAVHSHIVVIKDKALRRQVIDLCTDMRESAFDVANVQTPDLLATLNDEVLKILAPDEESNCISIGKAAEGQLTDIQSAQDGEKQKKMLWTGLYDLDSLLNGLPLTSYTIVAAPTSIGKTALALQIADESARQAKPSLIFSMEMSHEQLAKRYLAAKSCVNMKFMDREKGLSQIEWDKISRAANDASKLPLYIVDRGARGIGAIYSQTRTWKLRLGVETVIVDYLQLVTSRMKGAVREQEVAEVSRGLKAIAMELNVRFIVPCQMSRAFEARGPKARPKLSDLRESGAIEQDADNVIFVWRPRGSSDQQVPCELIVEKARNGETGSVDVLWHGPTQRYLNKSYHPEKVNLTAQEAPF